MNFGLFKYGYSNNIGDEIQSLAAAQFLPRIDTLIERDRLHWNAQDRAIFCIFNGWFAAQPAWPPPPSIHPLFVSFYAHSAPNLIRKEFRDYFRQYEPIGCRSPVTVAAFREIGVEAYFSGCLTLTLQRVDVSRSDKVYALDVEQDLYEQVVPKRIRQRAVKLSNSFPPIEAGAASNLGWQAWQLFIRMFNKCDSQRRIFRSARDRADTYRHDWRMGLAKGMLRRLSEAQLVITSRLHCAMPCLALGTPVVLVRRGIECNPRFSGLWQLVRCSGDPNKPIKIDWDRPEENADDFRIYADRLAAVCKQAITAVRRNRKSTEQASGPLEVPN